MNTQDIYKKIKKSLKISSIEKKANLIDDDGLVSITPQVLLASSKKVLDVNRGLVEQDERDSLRYKKILTPDKLLTERIQLDATGVAKKIVQRASMHKSLKGVNVNAFDGYFDSLLFGSALASPLEEINPLHLVEQQRRITQMGEGGLSGSDTISPEANAVHPHQFGFLDMIHTPESERAGVDSRAAWGTKIGDNGQIYQRFLDKRRKKYVWLSPRDLHNKTVGIPD